MRAPGVWALCFDGEGARLADLSVPAIEYGAENDGAAQAHRLFTDPARAGQGGRKDRLRPLPAQRRRLDGRLQPAAARGGLPHPGGVTMRVIGITGRSGCGKSTVTRLYASLGCPCLDADAVAREVLQPGSPCIAQLQNAFGSDIVEADGTLRRRLLADRAFAHKGRRRPPDRHHPPGDSAPHCRLGRRDAPHRRRAGVCGRRGHRRHAVRSAVRRYPAHHRAPYEQSVARICARDGIEPAMARRRLDAQTPEAALRQSRALGAGKRFYPRVPGRKGARLTAADGAGLTPPRERRPMDKRQRRRAPRRLWPLMGLLAVLLAVGAALGPGRARGDRTDGVPAPLSGICRVLRR